MIRPIDILYILLSLMGIGLIAAILLLLWVIWRVKRMNLPADTGFLATLRVTPISVVILLDVLDFALDFLSAPFSWVILNYLGLKPLRTVTVIESLIPGSELLPTMTIAWVLARIIPPDTTFENIIDGKIVQKKLPLKVS